MKERETIMNTRQLSVGYGSGKNAREILKDLDLEIKRGDLISFIGPNGVGKSTLIRTLSGLQPALDGSVWLMGKNISEQRGDERARSLSLVLTEKIEAGNLTVKELVIMGRYPRTNWRGTLSEEDHRKVQEAIDATRINYLEHRKIQELSDGQIQKALIARALAQDGDLIILDEPTAHLDINNRVEIMRLLKDLSQKSGKAILISSHDLDLAVQVSDILWLANWNKPLVMGAPEDIILSDHLTETFRSDDFIFDQNSGRFLFKTMNKGSIHIEGPDSIRTYWTRKAFERIGIHHKQDSDQKVVVLENTWAMGNETYSSLYSLLEQFQLREA